SRNALLGDAEEAVRMTGGADAIDGDLDAAARAVLEADGHRETRRQFAMHLALGGAGPDGTPGDQIRRELRRNRIEKFRARRQAHLGEIEEQPAGDPQALVDIEIAVEIGIVDEPFPTDRGAGFFEI